MNTLVDDLPHGAQPRLPQQGVPAKIWVALVCNLVSWLFLVLAACLLPTLLSVAGGLFFFIGVPFALISLCLLIACTCLLVTNRTPVSQWMRYGVLASTTCCWIAHLIFIVAAIVLLSLLMA